MSKPQQRSQLEQFYATADDLTDKEKLLIIDQAIALIEGFYVNLPLKRAMHAVDPVQRLRLLRHRLDRFAHDRDFHAEMTEIFGSVRDLHANYMLPAPYRDVVARLPFRVESCVEDGERIYLVSGVKTAPDPAFEPGVRLTHWNGVPIEREVRMAGDRHPGGNAAARHALGIAGLTHRGLVVARMPDEEWVTVSYIGLDGTAREARFVWDAAGLPPAISDQANGMLEGNATGLGFDLHTHIVQRMRQLEYAPQARENAMALARNPFAAPEMVEGMESILPELFTARTVKTASGIFGYIRIWSFGILDSDPFLDEFIRLLGLMPPEGLIIDVRDNGGGLVNAAERILQTLTPRRIQGALFQFVNTPGTRLLTATVPDDDDVNLSDWSASIAQAIETGATFSRGLPLTTDARANDRGQCYSGPVVLITSARSYSATDIFAAGFQDHAIGAVLGVDPCTGAGGANVWKHALILEWLSKRGSPIHGSPLTALPREVGLRVAARRVIRVGRNAGTELEDLGVVPDHLHEMTRRDVLEGNADLINRAAALLADAPACRFEPSVSRTVDGLALDMDTGGLDRLDIFVDARPVGSVDLDGGGERVLVAASPLAETLELHGYNQGGLLATRRVAIADLPSALITNMTAKRTRKTLTLRFEAVQVDRIEFELDDQAFQSEKVRKGVNKVALPVGYSDSDLILRGYRGDNLVYRRTISLYTRSFTTVGETAPPPWTLD